MFGPVFAGSIDVVHLEVADRDGVGDVLRRLDRRLRRRLGDEDGGHADDRGHDRELRAGRAQEPALLDRRGDLPLQPRDGEAVVVGARAPSSGRTSPILTSRSLP